MRIAVILLLLLTGCGNGGTGPAPAEPAAASVPDPAAEATTPKPSVPLSKGWQKTRLGPVEPLTEAQLAKQEAIYAADSSETGPDVPAALSGRRIPRTAQPGALIDVYRDGALLRTHAASEFDEPRTLADLLVAERAGLRSVLAAGESGALWVEIDDLGRTRVRRNKRGLAKMERMPEETTDAGPNPGKVHRVDAKSGKGKRELREFQVRDLYWLELRSTASALLPGEPGYRAPDEPDP